MFRANVLGVQKITWDTEAHEFRIDWSTTEINMNGILTYSAGSNMVYCSGKEADCNYYYYGLNWDNGELVLRKLLGPEGTFLDDPFYDGGNGNVIDEKGNIYFAGGASLVKVERVDRPTSQQNPLEEFSGPLFFPNPVTDRVNLSPQLSQGAKVSLYNYLGQMIYSTYSGQAAILVKNLPSGMYHSF